METISSSQVTKSSNDDEVPQIDHEEVVATQTPHVKVRAYET